MRMRLLAGAVLVAALGAAPVARAADDGVNLSTVTCGEARKDGAAVGFRFLGAAYAGRLAAKAGHARFSPDLVKVLGDALRRACEGTDAADRKLADVVAGIAIPAKGDKDRDFATMTCAQLAPLWKEEARQMVPFLVALRDATDATPLTKVRLDKVGDGLPKTCREAGNEKKLVLDLVKGLQ